jgi:hypothetical protein
MQWGWNHNPDSTKWSLTQNPGHLRLSTVKVVSNLRNARNTLTQRIFAYYTRTLPTTATVKINVDKMQDGDVAGLAVFQDPYAFIGIKQLNGLKYVVMVNNGKSIDSAAVNASTLYLRANAHYGTSRASFAYSLDNQSFTKLGNELSMRFNLSIFTGNKFCLFNYPTTATGGFVDFDWFKVGVSTSTEVAPEGSLPSQDMPHDFFLGQNYPNPFNPLTQIRYMVPRSSYVTLGVYNLLGQEVATIYEGIRQPGNYEATFDGSALASGAYLYRMQATQTSGGQAGKYEETKKLLLMR